MLRLVLGISSAGKSTYITNALARQFPATPIFMAHEIGDRTDLSDSIVHYNLLRPFDNSITHSQRDLHHDPILKYFLGNGMAGATMLVCRPATLIDRALSRSRIEPGLRRGAGRYPKEQIVEFVYRADLGELHRRWMAWLQDSDISLRVLSSEGPYRELTQDEALGLSSISPTSRYPSLQELLDQATHGRPHQDAASSRDPAPFRRC